MFKLTDGRGIDTTTLCVMDLCTQSCQSNWNLSDAGPNEKKSHSEMISWNCVEVPLQTPQVCQVSTDRYFGLHTF